MTGDQRELYEEVILEHNRHPRHFPENPSGSNHHAHGFNPLCDDEIAVHLKVADGYIAEAGFEGAGCAVAMASASMMTEAIQGKTLAEVDRLFDRVHAMLAEDGPADAVGKLKVLSGGQGIPHAGEMRHPGLAHPAGSTGQSQRDRDHRGGRGRVPATRTQDDAMNLARLLREPPPEGDLRSHVIAALRRIRDP